MKESEIRPKDIFDEYLRLAKIDTINYFTDELRLQISCPACNSLGEYSVSAELTTVSIKVS